jgi:UDP-glucose 4-epimerase
MTNSEAIKSTDNLKHKTVLITGGCGFIGTNLVRFLFYKGYTLKILDNLSTSKKKNLLDTGWQQYPNNILIGDIRDQDTVNEATTDIDAVVHLAANPGITESIENPQEVWEINVTGTLNMLEACRINGVKAFIFASSNAVLGKHHPPANESKVPKPLSPYGAAKLAGEALCSAYYYTFGLNTASLRFANCYGPVSQHKSSVVAKFIKRIKQHKPLTIYGNGEQTRDFIHVDDICQAISLCLSTDSKLEGQVFQIASGRETSINKLISILKEITGHDTPIINEPKRKGDIQKNYSDITKARKKLGFEPNIELKSGLNELWKWYKDQTDQESK